MGIALQVPSQSFVVLKFGFLIICVVVMNSLIRFMLALLLCLVVHGDMGYHCQLFTEEACYVLASVCWYPFLYSNPSSIHLV